MTEQGNRLGSKAGGDSASLTHLRAHFCQRPAKSLSGMANSLQLARFAAALLPPELCSQRRNPA